ncbi:GNAT family N-acetyltransferase [Psychrobacter sp. C 20.9]|uniref:GNAT family N-acetyltransferase n=1 Tax=Psychrobacter sp. C 20.9 TaxID=1926477 RepID=UPI000946A40D|nr:GNAT family N-acetyltransferase [Psychrobacter sp. C 20.9]OLF38681.1 GNAT family N-acetyltransferase [Psychrobacter sp. C 20.9]
MFSIRKAEQKDYSDIAKVHVHSWHDTYLDLLPISYINEMNNLAKKTALWEQILRQPEVEVWVAQDGDTIVGFIGYYSQNERYEITTLYILPTYQHQGMGSTLMKASLQDIIAANAEARFHLWVLDTNSNAINFYKKHGFEQSAERHEEMYENAKIIDIKMIKNTDPLTT